MKDFLLNAVIGLLLFLAGVGAGLMPSYYLQPSAITSAVYNMGLLILVIALSLFAITIICYVVPKVLWPGRGDWLGELNDGAHKFVGNDAIKSRSDTLQKKGNYYLLRIAKHSFGRARVIDRIWFVPDIRHDTEIPNKYIISLFGLNSEKKKIEGSIVDYEHQTMAENLRGIYAEFEPMKVIRIMVEIVEPSTADHYWSIEDIRIREVLFFGKWIKREI